MLKKLKDECYIVMGQSPSSANYNSDKTGTPFMQGRKTFGDKYPTIDTWTTKLTKIAPKGSILMSVRAPVGDVNVAPCDLCIGRGLASIKMKNGNNQYLYYLLKNNSELLKNKSTGTVFEAINKDDLENLVLDFHSENEQNKISTILTNIDKKIELNNKMNSNLYEIGKSYFNDYISKCSDKVFIRDIADEILDYTKNKNNKVKLLNSSDVTENSFPNVNFVDNVDLKGHFKKRFKKYDILYSQIRPRNHHYGYVLLDDSDNYLASTRFMVVRNKSDKVSSSLLYYYLTSKNAVDDFTTKTELRSGTFPQGNYEDLSSYIVKYSTEQEKITKILDSVLEKIYLNNNEIKKLSELRDALLPKLMNGEIDLDNIEI